MLFQVLLIILVLIVGWMLVSGSKREFQRQTTTVTESKTTGLPTTTHLPPSTAPPSGTSASTWTFPRTVVFTPHTSIPITASNNPQNTCCLALPLAYSHVIIYPGNGGSVNVIRTDGITSSFSLNDFPAVTTSDINQLTCNNSSFTPATSTTPATWSTLIPGFSIPDTTIPSGVRTYTIRVDLTEGTATVLPDLTFTITGSQGCVYILRNDATIVPASVALATSS